MTNSVSASELKARCSEIVNAVAAGRQAVVVTLRGRPIAKIVPVEDEAAESLFGRTRGRVTINGDIMAPIDVDWEATQ